MLRREQRTRNMILFTMVLFLLIGVGYAMISTNLSINGNLAVDKVTWDVHFENIVLDETNTVEGTPVLSNNDTSIDYTVNLQRPGDYYSFSVDVVNNGTIDAMIATVTPEGLTNAQKEFINYSLTYEDGNAVAEKDALKKGGKEKLVIIVEYKYDITNNDLLGSDLTMNLKLQTNYVQDDGTSNPRPDTLYNIVASAAVSDAIASTYVSASTGIDFKSISSDTNGKGVYLFSETQEDDYPVYYYRGNVSNNNVKFAGICWKAVRTTETGGTKLIYNGLPDGNGYCTNTTGDATQLSSGSKYNDSYNALSYVGYMMGTTNVAQQYDRTGSDEVYGNYFEYDEENDTYTLTDTVTKTSSNSLDSRRHYTCFNDSGVCDGELYYVFYSYYNNQTLFYITLQNGVDIDDALESMFQNETNSVIKTVVDGWFEQSLIPWFTNQSLDYNNFLEDTIWCNDRIINEYAGWNPNGGSNYNYLTFNSDKKPYYDSYDFLCSNKKDSFTVNETTTGNGLLTYPVGLLTKDEAGLAGIYNGSNTTNYLYTGRDWWTMTPTSFWDRTASIMAITSDGYFSGYYATASNGVRPSISLSNKLKVVVGTDGTANNPYQIIMN